MAKLQATIADGIPGFLFRISMEGFDIGQASKIDGLNADNEVITYRGGAESDTVRKQRGLMKYGDVTIERMYTNNSDAWNMLGLVFEPTVGLLGVSSPIYKTNMTISMLNHDGTERVKFYLRNVWVKSYEINNLDANSSNYSVEKIVLTHEGLSKIGVDL